MAYVAADHTAAGATVGEAVQAAYNTAYADARAIAGDIGFVADVSVSVYLERQIGSRDPVGFVAEVSVDMKIDDDPEREP